MLFVIGVVFFLSGCTHPLTVKNIGMYQDFRYQALDKPIKLGIMTEATNPEDKQLVGNVADELMKHSVQPIMPYSGTTQIPVDAVAKIDIMADHNGSGLNFLINWPGFLIFTPAWNGYIYEVNYKINVNLINPVTKNSIDQFTLPISLDIRHADYNRTWTELSWFEVSVIAFIGGIVFTSYDDSVTPLLVEKIGPTIGKYVAKEIINRLKTKGGFAYQNPYGDTPLSMSYLMSARN